MHALQGRCCVGYDGGLSVVAPSLAKELGWFCWEPFLEALNGKDIYQTVVEYLLINH